MLYGILPPSGAMAKLKKGINNTEVEIQRKLMCSWNDCMTYISKLGI